MHLQTTKFIDIFLLFDKVDCKMTMQVMNVSHWVWFGSQETHSFFVKKIIVFTG